MNEFEKQKTIEMKNVAFFVLLRSHDIFAIYESIFGVLTPSNLEFDI